MEEANLFLVEIDLKDFFDMIPHEKMMSLIEQKMTDEKVVSLIYKYIHCDVTDGQIISEKKQGLIQGNPISTSLSNLYLHNLDMYMENQGYRWLRFADNIYVYCNKKEEAAEIYNAIVQ